MRGIFRRSSKNQLLSLLNDGAFVGELRPLAFAVTGTGIVEIEPGWLYCNGASLSRADYKRLYDEIGLAYGSVDVNSFTLPDFRGRSPLPHVDGQSGTNRVAGAIGTNATATGGIGGADTVTLVKANLVRHGHEKGTLAIAGGSHGHGPGTLTLPIGQGGGAGVNGRQGASGTPGTIGVNGSLAAASHGHASGDFAGSTEDGTVSGLGGGAHANAAPHLPATGMAIRA